MMACSHQSGLPHCAVCLASTLVIVATVFIVLAVVNMSSLEVNKWNNTVCVVNSHKFGGACCLQKRSIFKHSCVDKKGTVLTYRSHVSKCAFNQVNMTAGTSEDEASCIEKSQDHEKILSAYGEHRCWVDCDQLVFKLMDPKEQMQSNLDSLIIWFVVLWLSGSVCYCQVRRLSITDIGDDARVSLLSTS